MEKIILRRQIKIWLTPAKNAWWVLNITGTKLRGQQMMIDHVSTEHKTRRNNSITKN